MTSDRASRLYGRLQSIIFCAYAAAVLLDRTRQMFGASTTVRRGGTGLAVAGVVLMLVAIRTIGRSIQVAPAPKASATLRTDGVYRWFRHPIYTGIVAIAIGLFLRRPTVLVAAATAVVIGFLMVKVRFEERLLVEHYAAYAAYQKRTWSLLPFLRR